MGNFVHFTLGALALLKYASANQSSLALWIAAKIYVLFAILFGVVVFTPPTQKPAS